MPYQYGMQNSPSGGNGLGGLPKKQTTPRTVNFTRIVTAGSGVIVPPANAKYMRVAAIGSGGSSGNSTYGAGGGGCAASKIVPAAPIVYSITAPALTSGGGTVAEFPGYRLFGGRGGEAVSDFGPRGIGTGGDYNYSGGLAGVSKGGGAAGPMGNGGDADSSPILSDGWGVGGGSGSRTNAIGGAGSGAVVPSSSITTYNGATVWGNVPIGATGGLLGGGGAGNGTGGVGGVVVEWFYD